MLYETMDTYSLSTADSFQAKLAPWSPADLATDGRILVWKVCSQFFVKCAVGIYFLGNDLLHSRNSIIILQGIGNSVATWHPCFLVLSGSYLYVFESAKSRSYQRYLRFNAFISILFLGHYFQCF